MASHAQTAVDLPARWVVGIVAASAAACLPVALAVVRAGIRRYERLVGPLTPAEAFQPATEPTPVPFSTQEHPVTLFSKLAATLQRIPPKARLGIYAGLAAIGAALVALGELTEAEVDGALEFAVELLGIGALVTAASNTPTGGGDA